MPYREPLATPIPIPAAEPPGAVQIVAEELRGITVMEIHPETQAEEPVTTMDLLRVITTVPGMDLALALLKVRSYSIHTKEAKLMHLP